MPSLKITILSILHTLYKAVNMEQKAAAKQLSRHPSIDYSWMDQDITTLLLHSPWVVE